MKKLAWAGWLLCKNGRNVEEDGSRYLAEVLGSEVKKANVKVVVTEEEYRKVKRETLRCTRRGREAFLTKRCTELEKLMEERGKQGGVETNQGVGEAEAQHNCGY